MPGILCNRIVRKIRSLVSVNGFRRVSGEGQGLVSADGLGVAGAAGGVAAVTDARG